MKDCNIYITIIEPSQIVYEGLSHILLRVDHHSHIYRFEGLQELHDFPEKEKLNVVIINPSFIVSNRKSFNAVKRSLPNANWIGLLYSYFDRKIIEQFDNTIKISDDHSHIKRIVCKTSTDDCGCKGEEKTLELSEREKKVLIELVNGLSNKEIADKLFISTHTVASHRKNITGKTGIKSLSGLTIYAITQGIVSLDEL